MGFNDEYQKLRKKRLEEEGQNQSGGGMLYRNKTATAEDIAPVVTSKKTETTEKDEDEGKKWWQGFVQKGDAFEDGYQFGDVTKTLLGTDTDIATNLISGIAGWGEEAADAVATGLGMVSEKMGWDGAAKKLNEFAQRDLYDENAVARKILTSRMMPDSLRFSNKLLFTLEEWLNPTKVEDNGFDGTMLVKDDNSVLGDTSDSLIQSAGETFVKMGATAGLGGVPIGDIITGVTVFGEQAEQALREDATFGQAAGSGLISASAEIMFEKLSGGIKIGGRTLDEGLTKIVSKNISNVALRNAVHFGLDVAGEAGEEVATEFVSKLGTKLYKEEDLGEILFSEDALNEYIQAAIGGGLMGGAFNVSGAVSGAKHGVDYKTGLNNDESAVVDKIADERIAEQEKDGKLTAKQKNDIREQVMRDLERGRISVDDIERVLGGASYQAYRDMADTESAKQAEVQKKIEELENLPNEKITVKQAEQLKGLRQELQGLKDSAASPAWKDRVSESVMWRASGTRLAESYRERARRGQAFEADLSKYDTKQAEIVKKAAESGILNNTNRTHEFVDMVAKISADKGVLFDFTNNAKLKESGFAVEGATVNGYFDKKSGTIGVNIDSAKAFDTVVGHEITHVIEGTELYSELQKAVFDYAKTKGEFDGRRAKLAKLYAEEDIDSEMTADLIGEYLFTDEDFVQSLSVQNRNVFQKIYDEIKYLVKVVTAGSKEARKLEEVKRAFDKAYREGVKADKSGDVKHSLSEDSDFNIDDYTIEELLKFSDEQFQKAYDALGLDDLLAEELTDSEIADLFGDDDVSIDDISEELKVEPEKIEILVRRKGLGESHVEENRSAVMKQERINQEIKESGAGHHPDYARKYITRISPKDFIDLTVLQGHVDRGQFDADVRGDFGGTMNDFDYEKALQDSQSPYLEIDFSTGRIIGHNGRHRIRALEKAGVESVEIVLELFDEDGHLIKYNAETIPDLAISSQFDTAIETHLSNVIPLNEVHRGEIERSYGEKAHANAGVKYSLSDSDGKKLSKSQQEYFKDSKMRDENGNLKVMYHGSRDAGFHVFDPGMSDDDTSLFFVDRNDVAASYSGTTETYEAQSIRTAEDMNKFIESIGVEGYEVLEHDGKFDLIYEDDLIASRDTAKEIYEEFCWYEGVGEGDANYKVYLNLKNPLVVDGKGRPWNKIDAEFSQEVYDKYQSLTAEEKAALTDLAEWEDFSLFNSELQLVDTGELASAYAKMGEDCNIYDLFSVAADNFSEESMRENARGYLKTRDYAQRAKEQGYDGVIFNNIVDNGGFSNGSEGASTVAIAFESSQIKSVANENPTGDPDIRYSLSEDSEGRQLTDAQKAKFKGSKVVDENGNLKVVYHGSPADFNTFSLEYLGTNGTAEGYGFYFTDSKRIADGYSQRGQNPGKLFEVYLDIKKPLSDTKVTMTKAQFKKFLTELNKQVDADGERLDILSNYGDVEWEGLNNVLNYAIELEYEGNDTDVDIVDSIINSCGNIEVVFDVLRKVTGYDGIIVEQATWGDDQTIYIAFHPEQIKNVDNLNPTDDPDTRYHRSAEGEAPGKGRFYGKDIRLEQEIAPVAEDVSTTTEQAAPEAVAPVENVTPVNDWMPDIAPDTFAPVSEKAPPAVLYNKRGGENGWDAAYSTAQEALNDAVQNTSPELWAAFNEEIDNNSGSTPITHALIAVQEDVRQETITPMQGAQLLNDAYNEGGVDALKRLFNPYTGNLFPKHLERAKQYETIAPVSESVTYAPTLYDLRDERDALREQMLAVKDDLEAVAPLAERYGEVMQQIQQLEADESERLASLDDADVPPEVEAPYYESESVVPDDPFESRDIKAVGDRKVKAYMYENPEVKPFFQQEANIMLGELANTTKGERFYTETPDGRAGVYGAESYGYWTGTSRHTTDDIAYLLDTLGYSYAEIENGLKAIIEDNGAENNACSKRIEFILHDRLMNGYNTLDAYGEIPPNQEYINLINEKQIMEYSDEARKQFFAVADRYAPPENNEIVVEPIEDIAPVASESIRPKAEPREPSMKRVAPTTENATADVIAPGTRVRASDRGNVGTVKSYDAATGKYKVSFTNKNGLHATVELDASVISPLTKAPTNETVTREVFNDRAKAVYHSVKDKQAGKYHKVGDYGFHLARSSANESATITVKTPDGKKLQRVIQGGNFWKNSRLWSEAAKMVAEHEYPNVESPKSADDVQGKVAEILVGETPKPKSEKSPIMTARTHLFDRFSVFEDVALENNNRELDAKANYMRSAEQRAQYFIGHGADGVRALADLEAEVDKAGLKKQFYEYMYDMHNTDRMSLEDKAKPVIERLGSKFGDLRIDQIRAIAAKEINDKTSAKTAQTIRDAQEYLNALETQNKPVRGYDYTADISRENAARLEAKYPQFKKWAQEVYDNNKFMREILVEKGMVSRETADLWAEIYPHYVPIRRAEHSGSAVSVPLDTNKTGVNAPVKRATGGDGNIEDMFNTMALRAKQTYTAAARNSFGVELMNTLGTTITRQKATLDEAIDGVESDHQEGLLKKGENGAKPTFTVFENGERVEFEITEDMYEALKPSHDFWNKKIPGLSHASEGFRKILTEYNLAFTLPNAVKDVQEVVMNSQHPLRTYANMPQAYWQIIKGGEWNTEYMKNGGEQNTYFDGEEMDFKSYFDGKKIKSKDKSVMKYVGMPLNWISNLNNVIERAPRLAEYMASRKAGASAEVAMLDAARVTTNFAAGGDITKFANRNGVTFLNASVQGFNQQVRNVREAKAKGFKGWAQLAAKTLILGVPALILNGLIWDDDEDYEELSDYVKKNYYVVAKYGDGQFVRIPKGRTAAVIQNAMVETMDMVTGDDEKDLQYFLDKVWGMVSFGAENLAPNNPIDNNILAPIIGVANNETWYGEDLVPTRLQDLPAAEQYDESTDAISKWIGETAGDLGIDISPYKVNYLLDQYSGGVGDIFLPMLTPDSDGGGILAPFKDKFTTDSTMKNQNVSNFYNTVDELTKNAKSSKATDEDVLKYKYMNSINAELSELYKQKREIQNSDLSDAKKYDAVRNIQKKINSLASESLETYKGVYINDGYATVGDIHYRLKDGEWQKISDDQLEKQNDVVDGLGIDPSEYWANKSEYDFAYEYPEKYAVAKSVGGYEKYKTYSSELYDIKADKDENGKSITGSRKEKVIDYINNLDADYGERLILFKNEYNADDTYNEEIIDYLNGREDISYDEMVTILLELGFTVKNGHVYWD